jgi:SMC interacting uncharacterized protein involved in chromosome segregation
MSNEEDICASEEVARFYATPKPVSEVEELCERLYEAHPLWRDLAKEAAAMLQRIADTLKRVSEERDGRDIELQNAVEDIAAVQAEIAILKAERDALRVAVWRLQQ